MISITKKNLVKVFCLVVLSLFTGCFGSGNSPTETTSQQDTIATFDGVWYVSEATSFTYLAGEKRESCEIEEIEWEQTAERFIIPESNWECEKSDHEREELVLGTKDGAVFLDGTAVGSIDESQFYFRYARQDGIELEITLNLDENGSGSYDEKAFVAGNLLNRIFIRFARERKERTQVEPLENRAPTVFVSDLVVDKNASVTFLAVSTDPDGDKTTTRIGQQPENGSLSGTQMLTYTPNKDFVGTDSFTLIGNDGKLDSVEKEIKVTVRALDEGSSISPSNSKPVALDQSLHATAGVALPVSLSGKDDDGDSLSFEVLRQPNHGTLIKKADTYEYTAPVSYQGNDSFAFRTYDGELYSSQGVVTISVAPSKLLPLAFDQNYHLRKNTSKRFRLSAYSKQDNELELIINQPPSNGTLSGTYPRLVYTPNQDFSGTDSIRYQVFDGVNYSNESTVSFSVSGERKILVTTSWDMADFSILEENEFHAASASEIPGSTRRLQTDNFSNLQAKALVNLADKSGLILKDRKNRLRLFERSEEEHTFIENLLWKPIETSAKYLFIAAEKFLYALSGGNFDPVSMGVSIDFLTMNTADISRSNLPNEIGTWVEPNGNYVFSTLGYSDWISVRRIDRATGALETVYRTGAPKFGVNVSTDSWGYCVAGGRGVLKLAPEKGERFRMVQRLPEQEYKVLTNFISPSATKLYVFTEDEFGDYEDGSTLVQIYEMNPENCKIGKLIAANVQMGKGYSLAIPQMSESEDFMIYRGQAIALDENGIPTVVNLLPNHGAYLLSE